MVLEVSLGADGITSSCTAEGYNRLPLKSYNNSYSLSGRVALCAPLCSVIDCWKT